MNFDFLIDLKIDFEKLSITLGGLGIPYTVHVLLSDYI